MGEEQMIDITIRQSNPNCLVYYTIAVGDWIYEGDALDINSALTMIQHNLQQSLLTQLNLGETLLEN